MGNRDYVHHYTVLERLVASVF